MDRFCKKLHGFTLIEIMITLSIAAILASLAAPSFNNLIKNNRLTTQYNDLLTALSLTRSEAVKQGIDVIILSNNSSDWSAGWTIFADVDKDDNADSAEIINVHGPLSAGNILKFNRGGKVTFHSSGLGGATGTFTLCDDRTSPEHYAKAIILSNTGRARKAIDTNNDGIVDNGDVSNFKNVSCTT